MMKYLISVLLLNFFSHLSFSQSPFKGTVRDAETKEPLPFTNIGVIGKYKGTVSNVEGNFTLGSKNILPTDTVAFTHVGYQTFKIVAEKLRTLTEIELNTSALELKTVHVLSDTLTTEGIVQRVLEKYDANYQNENTKKELFFHKIEKVGFPPKNKAVLRESDFEGISSKDVDELLSTFPREVFFSYDALVDLYSFGKEVKLSPQQGVCLVGKPREMSVGKKVSNKFIELMEKRPEEGVYYKIRTGILGYKLKSGLQDSLRQVKTDSSFYIKKTSEIKEKLLSGVKSIKYRGKAFLNQERYVFTLEEVTRLEDSLAYKLSFKPKAEGLFTGYFYVSVADYTIFQFEYEYLKGKSKQKKLLGITASRSNDKGYVVFGEGKSGHFVKYIYAHQKDEMHLKRDFIIKKKKERILVDKELNRMRIGAELYMASEEYQELLILENTEMDSVEFKSIQEPEVMKFEPQSVYSSELWENRSVITPTAELLKYEREDKVY